MEKEKIYLNALISSKLLTRKRLLALKQVFASWEGVYFNLNQYLLADLGIDFEKVGERYKKFKAENPDEAYEKLFQAEIKLLDFEDINFPYLLKQIKDPPLLLYFKGDYFEPRKSLAIVGSRSPTFYGEKITKELSSLLGDLGVTIISGLALGVDTIAHENSYFRPGKTIAIMGNSLDLVYPRENINLSEKILSAGGVLVSEYPLGTNPEVYQFPERNRLIAGMSFGVLITEASKKSGTRITAEFALEQGREVLCVPGAITNELSQGTNQLLKEGASVVTSIQDVLDVFGWGKEIKKEFECSNLLDLKEEERKIFNLLSFEPRNLTDIISETCFDFLKVSQNLSFLELKGLIRNIGNNRYVRT